MNPTRIAFGRRGALLCALAVAPALLTAAPAHAAWTWPAAAAFATAAGKDASAPAVATDRACVSTALWVRSADDSIGSAVVELVTRPAGGAWSSPQVVSTATGKTVATPRVAFNADGAAVAAWTEADIATRSKPAIFGMTKPAGGAWSAPVQLSTGTDETNDPQVAIDAAGRATVAWNHKITSTDPALNGDTFPETRATDAAGAWLPIEAVADRSNQIATFPSLAVGPDGTAAIGWIGQDASSGNATAKVAVRSAGDTDFGAERLVSDPGEWGTFPTVSISRDDAVTIAWQERTGNVRYARNHLLTRELLPGGALTTVEALTPYELRANAQDATIVTDADGNQTASWLRTQYELVDPGTGDDTERSVVDQIQVATRPAGATAWSAPTTVGEEPTNPTLRHVILTARHSGGAAVAWAGYTAADKKQKAIRAATRETFTGGWERATLSAAGGTSSSQMTFDPAVAGGPGDEVTVLWHRAQSSGLVRVEHATRATAPAVEPEPVAPTPEQPAPTPEQPVTPAAPVAPGAAAAPAAHAAPAPATGSRPGTAASTTARTPIRLTATWSRGGRLVLRLTGVAKTSRLSVKVPGRAAKLTAKGTRLTVPARDARTGQTLTVRVTDARGKVVATRTVKVPRRR